VAASSIPITHPSGPKTPAPHSPLFCTAILDITVTGDSNALTVFKDGLGSDTGHVDTLEGATGIRSSRSLSGGDLTQCWEDIRNSSCRGW
jgi:hypothetical protein